MGNEIVDKVKPQGRYGRTGRFFNHRDELELQFLQPSISIEQSDELNLKAWEDFLWNMDQLIFIKAMEFAKWCKINHADLDSEDGLISSYISYSNQKKMIDEESNMVNRLNYLKNRPKLK